MKKHLLVLGFFVVAVLVVTYPLIFHLTTKIIDTGDGLLINWIINWNVHSLRTNIFSIFNTNIFYPYKNTLAFSDLLFLQTLIALPFMVLFKEPLLAFNVNLLTGFILTGFSTYLLVFYLTKRTSVAVLGGILLTFSPIHLDFLVHQQLFSFWPVIFAWYFLLKKNYFWYVVFFVLSGWSTMLFVQFLILISIVYKKFIPLLFALIFTAPFVVPYFLVSAQWHYVRPITDAIHFSLQIPDLFNPGPYSRLGNIGQFSSHYFGLGILILIFLNFRKFTLNNKFILIAVAAFILALGPALHIFRTTIHVGPIPAIPLPYTIFYYLIPGFSGFRTPSRWVLLCVLALVIFLLTLLKNKLNLKIIAILIVITFLEIPLPITFQNVKSVKDFPPENYWLSKNYIGSPIIYFPVYNWNDLNPKNWESERMYYSTVDWHPMFNGYSGFTPQKRQDEIKWLQSNFPSQETFSFLQSLGIKLVIVPKTWAIKMAPYTQAVKIKEFSETYVYKI